MNLEYLSENTNFYGIRLDEIDNILSLDKQKKLFECERLLGMQDTWWLKFPIDKCEECNPFRNIENKNDEERKFLPCILTACCLLPIYMLSIQKAMDISLSLQNPSWQRCNYNDTMIQKLTGK